VGPSPQAAVSAITASRVEAALALGRTPIGAVYSSPEICWAISGIPMASFNAAIRVRPGPAADRQINEIREVFAQRAMPFVWWVTPRDSDDGLEAKLRAHGFGYGDEESIGMAVSLIGRAAASPARKSLSVARIFEVTDIRTWFATLLGSSERTVDDATMDLATTVYSHLSNDRHSGWQLYLAYMDDRPVGTCALHTGRAAGLYAVGTLPMARRRGVGIALTNQALADAASAGHRIATLTASGLGERLYRTLGFREYCRFREYVWRPTEG